MYIPITMSVTVDVGCHRLLSSSMRHFRWRHSDWRVVSSKTARRNCVAHIYTHTHTALVNVPVCVWQFIAGYLFGSFVQSAVDSMTCMGQYRIYCSLFLYLSLTNTHHMPNEMHIHKSNINKHMCTPLMTTCNRALICPTPTPPHITRARTINT